MDTTSMPQSLSKPPANRIAWRLHLDQGVSQNTSDTAIMESSQEQDLPRPMRIPSTPPPVATKRPPVTLRQQPRAVSVRAPKSRPLSGALQIRIEEHEHVGSQRSEQAHEQKVEEAPISPPAGPTTWRQKERSGSMNSAKPRPFGGKLRIDVDAAEMAAPPIIGSPLSYYSSKKLPSNTHEDHPVSMFTAAESNTESGLLSTASPFMEYGMIVSLVCDDRGGLVAAEGFASRDVRLEKLSYGVGGPVARLGLGGKEERRLFADGGFRLLSCPFRDCLFEVVPKMTYDATIALRSLADDTTRLSGNQHTLDNLRFKSEAETRLNAMMYKKLKGTQVIYGQTIQLRHMKTGKYVSLDSSPIPFRGSEYAPVFLDAGGPSSYFNVLPRFKLRSKGAPVQLTDQMILTGGTESQPFNLFVSNRNTTDGASTGVVGSSVHSSQWRALYYDNLDGESFTTSDEVRLPSKNDEGLRAGSCIRLLHLESSSWLGFHGSDAREFLGGPVTLQYSDENEQEDGTKKALSSDSLWEIEHVFAYEGGQIKWREAITLRHLITGKYLAVAHSQSPRATTRTSGATRLSSHICAQSVAQDQPQLFRFVPTAIADEESQIRNGEVVLIQHQKTNSFIHSIDTHASTMADIRLSSKPLAQNSSTSKSGVTSGGTSFSVVTLHGARDEDAFKVIRVPQSEVTDTLLLISYKHALSQFLDQFRVEFLSDDRSNLRFERESTIGVFRRVENVLGELIKFCVKADDDSADQLRSRQNLFRTYQYIELLVAMIKSPFQCYGGPFSIEEVCSFNDDYMNSSRDTCDDNDDLEMKGSPVRLRTDSSTAFRISSGSPIDRDLVSPRRSISTHDNSWRRKSTSGVSTSRLEIHIAAMQSLNRIIPAINVLLLHISWANRTNELYVVQVAMPVLMELLGNGFQTSLPLSYLLRENRNLVESITGCASIIRNFFELIATRGKSIRYMQFLVALCTSRGKGVPKTQEAICELLFNPANGYRDDVIIPIRPSTTGFDICTSNRVSSDINHDIEVMFNRSAKTNETGFSTGTWIPLTKFYEEYYVKAKHRALGQYCYGLFRLYVSLCLDRNYISIEYIQTAFPRENILYSVMDPHLSRSLRSVMMDLLRVAYVDCEPQKAMSCPNYTRIWTDIGASAAKAIPGSSYTGYSPEDLAFFTSLKDFCFSYLDCLQGAIVIDEIPENELTLAILRVSRKVTEFGMYASEDELSRVVALLFDLLDERTDFAHELPENNGIHGLEIKKMKGYNSPASLIFPPALHLRQNSPASNAQAPQQRKMSLVSDRRPGWGAASQPSTLQKNAVLFDGAGAMSSIRVTKERDASKQFKAVDRSFSRTPSGINSIAGANTESSPHRHLNKLLMHKIDTRTSNGVNVYEMDEVNRVVMEIKDEICAIFLLVDQVRVDFLISTLLASFQARHGGPPSSSPTRLRDPDVIHTALFDDAVVRETVSNAFTSRGLDIMPHGHSHADKISPLAVYLFGSKSLECKLSLTRLGRRVVTTIFMQMLMYEYPPLVSKALELLLQQYNQHDQFLKEMQNVQLLISEETISIYSKLKGDVDELRRLAETTEVWMDLTSRSDFEKASSVCRLLRSLLRVIEHTKLDNQVVSVEPRWGGARRQLRIQSPGKSTSDEYSSDDYANSAADLLSTNSKCAPKQVLSPEGQVREPVHDLAFEKQPPNLKLKYQTDRYVLNPDIGRVSQFSRSHDLVPPVWKNSPTGTGDASTGGDTKDNRTNAMEARRLLRNLRAAQFVLSMLIDGAHFYEGHFSDDSDSHQHSPGSPTTRSRTKLQKRQRDQIRGVFGQAMQFLRAFCTDDAENQALVAPHAAMIAEYVRELPIAQELLVVIYANNFPLYKSVPTELINTFVGRLIHDGPDPRYLFFLETLVLCDEQPIVENQLLVLFQLVKSFENAKVLQMFDDATQTVKLLGGLLSRHTNILQRTVDTNKSLQQHGVNTVDLTGSGVPRAIQPDNLADSGKMLEYHVRLLNLFAACATGKNTRVQEICQQIVPLVSVLDLLLHDDCTEGLQLALLRFLDQIFLTADDIETPGVDDLLHIMVSLTQVCERRVIQYLSYIHVKDLNRQATLSLRKNKSKAGKVIGLLAQKPLESAPLYLVLFSIIPTLFSFIQQFSSFVDNSEEAQYYLVQFNSYVALLLMVCAPSNWQLAEDVVSNIEEFIYVIDKSVRPIMLQYQVPMSLEQTWSMSLKYRERLDCSSLNCELDLPDILQWAIDMRDQETKTDTYTDDSRPSGLPDTTPSDTKDISPLDQAVRDGTSSINGADARSKAIASFKMDKLSTNMPIAWGDPGSKQPNQEIKESSPSGKAEHTSEAIEAKNQGILLHRLSPRRYYKGLRDKGALPYLSPKKETPVTPFSHPVERRVSDAFNALNSVYQSESMNYLVRQQHQFNELDQFLTWLQAHPRVHLAMRDELNQMVQGILGIETSMREEYNPHVHLRNVVLSFDLVVAKLVENVAALQDLSYLKTNLTLLNVFFRMIYAVEDAEERHNMQVKLNQLGVTRLVVQLISSRDNDALFTSSIEVGVALLDGMNAEVQESFYSYWSEPANEQFFSRIQGRIEKACKLIHSVDRTSVSVLDGLDSPGNVGDKKTHRRQSIFGLNLDNLSGDKASAAERGGTKRLGEPIASIFRFLQLLCEGHYLNAQRALIAQSNAAVSANLVESTTSFLLDTYLALTDLDMGLITQLFETITEYCQGPCVVAQETVANYKFISAVNALLTHSFEQRDTRAQDAVHQLRAAIVITLLSLLEGRSDHVIHSQLVQELNFEALKMNLVEVYVYFLRNHGTYAGNVKCSQDFYLTMGFNIYILLQQLADQNAHQAWWIPASEELQGNQAWLPLQPTRSKVLSACTSDTDRSPDFRDAFRFFQANCAKVEVVWDHHRSPTQYSAERTARGNTQGVSKESVSNFSGSMTNAPSADSDDVNTSSSGALMPFYFPIHPICFCLTAKSKKKLVWDVSRGGDKLSDFYTRSDKLVDEMTHQSHLQHHLQVAWVARKSEEIKRMSFALAVIINLVVLLFYRATGVYSRPFPASDVTFVHTWGQEVDPPKPSLWIDVTLSLAGTVQIILYSMVLICYMLNSAPLLIKKGWKRRHRKEQAKHAKRSVHNAHIAAEGKERESFQDTEQLLRSLREREEEYNYLFLPPSIRKRSAPKKHEPVSPRVKASVSGVASAKNNCVNDVKNGVATARGDFRVQLEITTISLYFLVRSPRVIYSLLQIFISVLGAYVNKLYFAFLLLDVVDRYKELNNVLRSISRPAKALGVTTLLYLIVVYVFAVVGFFFFREDYTLEKDITDAQIAGRAPYTCQRLFQCFLVSLDQGLKSDGGLGSYLRQIPLGTSAHSYGRLAFDVLYNILLVVLLLNLIFGVIIDTFASLRTNDQEKILDMQGRCFICSIDAYTFDRATKRGFHDHISRDHNMWHYLYLFVHIRKKSITDYTGLELFLAMRMAKKDMSFFPTHRALSLTKRGDLEENLDMDSATDDDRFYASSTTYGLKRYPATPFSPSRGASFLSGAPSSRRGSDQSRARARSKRNSSVTTGSRSVGYFDSIPAVDRATAGNLERIEATINELANAQNEIKEAQKRAEDRYAEFLATISSWTQQQVPLNQFPTPTTSMSGVSIGGSPPALSRRPSVRTQGSVTPRIFNFESVTDDFEARQSITASSLDPSPTASSMSRTLDSITPRTLNIEIESSTVEEDRPSFLDEGQDWFSASPEHRGPAPSPQNPSRTASLTYRLPSASDDTQSEYSTDMLRLSSQAGESPQQTRPSPSRKLGVVQPRIFNFEFISDDEEESKEGNPSPRQQQKL